LAALGADTVASEVSFREEVFVVESQRAEDAVVVAPAEAIDEGGSILAFVHAEACRTVPAVAGALRPIAVPHVVIAAELVENFFDGGQERTSERGEASS